MSFYYSGEQIKTVYKSQEATVQDVAEILFRSIKSNMLEGEAKIAVALMKELAQADSNSQIRLFDAQGKVAFASNNTLDSVNTYLKEQRFLPKTSFSENIMAYDRQKFWNSVNNAEEIFTYSDKDGDLSIEIYKPLINQPKCNTCHGVDHMVRGVIFVSHSLHDETAMAAKTQRTSTILFALMVCVLTTIIIIFLRRYIINRVIRIGKVVEKISDGDFDYKIEIVYKDEISNLGKEINNMIDELKEKFRLAKFVSKSTLEYVKKKEDISLGGKKETVTVMFTDIRGFTNYSEKREPEEVITALNKLMNLQVEIIDEFNGDIDKFVGDEIMAVYEGKDAAQNAVKTAIKIKEKIKNFDRGDSLPFYIGIGINTGEVIVGNMGSESRIDRTIIGDAVNLGARLCSIAGKNTIVISDNTYKEVQDIVHCIKQEPFKVKGKEKYITAYILKGLANENQS